jgi:S1-C subfamily serine protease
MSLGGCIIIDADRWDHEGEYWDRAERNSRQMIGVHTGRVGDSLAAQTGANPDRSTLITRVFSGRPAQVAGLEKYDVVVAINGQDSASPRQFRNAILDTPPGENITFTVIRRGERVDVTVTPQSAASLAAQERDDY